MQSCFLQLFQKCSCAHVLISFTHRVFDKWCLLSTEPFDDDILCHLWFHNSVTLNWSIRKISISLLVSGPHECLTGPVTLLIFRGKTFTGWHQHWNTPYMTSCWSKRGFLVPHDESTTLCSLFPRAGDNHLLSCSVVAAEAGIAHYPPGNPTQYYINTLMTHTNSDSQKQNQQKGVLLKSYKATVSLKLKQS